MSQRGRGSAATHSASHGRNLSLVLTLATGKQQAFLLVVSCALESCNGEITSHPPTSHVLFSHQFSLWGMWGERDGGTKPKPGCLFTHQASKASQKEKVLEFLVADDTGRPLRLVFAVSVPRRVRRQELTGTDQTSLWSGRFPVCKLQLC